MRGQACRRIPIASARAVDGCSAPGDARGVSVYPKRLSIGDRPCMELGPLGLAGGFEVLAVLVLQRHWFRILSIGGRSLASRSAFRTGRIRMFEELQAIRDGSTRFNSLRRSSRMRPRLREASVSEYVAIVGLRSELLGHFLGWSGIRSVVWCLCRLAIIRSPCLAGRSTPRGRRNKERTRRFLIFLVELQRMRRGTVAKSCEGVLKFSED